MNITLGQSLPPIRFTCLIYLKVFQNNFKINCVEIKYLSSYLKELLDYFYNLFQSDNENVEGTQY